MIISRCVSKIRDLLKRDLFKSQESALKFSFFLIIVFIIVAFFIVSLDMKKSIERDNEKSSAALRKANIVIGDIVVNKLDGRKFYVSGVRYSFGKECVLLNLRESGKNGLVDMSLGEVVKVEKE
jgi:hypothetical protein